MSEKNKFGLLIWSYNRAAQLDLLLSSLDRFCPRLFETYVLYKSVGEKFSEGYELCKTYHPNINFVPEYDFNKQTKEILSYHEFMGVSTDDTVVYKPFTLTEHDMKDVDIFSLRLGFNTTIQCPFTGKTQPSLSKYVNEGNTIVWDSRHYHPLTNYGFVMGHDMVVYSKKYFELVKEISFNKANELETKLFDFRDKINPFIRSFLESKAVNIPGNNNSGYTETDNSLPLDIVNKKFLDGKRFRMNEILEQKIIGCHQLFPLVMQ